MLLFVKGQINARIRSIPLLLVFTQILEPHLLRYIRRLRTKTRLEVAPVGRLMQSEHQEYKRNPQIIREVKTLLSDAQSVLELEIFVRASL